VSPPTQPSAAALRATRSLQKENGRRLLAREEFLTQEEIASLIDTELAPERERARELEAALVKCHSILRSINYNNDNHGFLNRNDAIAVDIAFEAANDILARLRADREGSK
jgi:hypothetical protein